MADKKFAFIASPTKEAQKALKVLEKNYGQHDVEHADCIITLGGDGLMLQTLHSFMNKDIAIFGMNCGSVGFLANRYSEDGLSERIARAEQTDLHPLEMSVEDSKGKKHIALAINEVALLRQTHQAAKLSISIDGRVRMEELICDGILLATPAGSTAYNLSAHGPILPIGAKLLALTPISAFRPRRWRGALLAHNAKVSFEILEPEKRPVSATADHSEMRNVKRVDIKTSTEHKVKLLFDKDHSLEERIINEQFFV